MPTRIAPQTTTPDVPAADATAGRPLNTAARNVMAVLRVMFGFTFLWAFLDKTFGLGFSTPAERAWVNGGDPTMGYLSNTEGTFGDVFQSLAGQFWVSPLFMAGLLGIGIALIAGAGLRIAAVAGALMYVLMYFAALPLTTNPIIDDHLTGAVALILFALAYAGDTWGLGRWWSSTSIVQRFPILR